LDAGGVHLDADDGAGACRPYSASPLRRQRRRRAATVRSDRPRSAVSRKPAAAPLVTLRIGPHGIRLPNCIAELIASRRSEDIELSGSWYHDQDDLPYYISVDFYAPGVKHERMSVYPHVNVLFSLHDARVLSVNELRSGWSWFGQSYRRLEPGQLCRKHELRSARLP
jgi:hypothetical protein